MVGVIATLYSTRRCHLPQNRISNAQKIPKRLILIRSEVNLPVRLSDLKLYDLFYGVILNGGKNKIPSIIG